MSNRNINLGGATDWNLGESPVPAADLNDTWDAVQTKVGLGLYEQHLYDSNPDLGANHVLSNEFADPNKSACTCLWNGASKGTVAFCTIFDDANNGGAGVLDATKWSTNGSVGTGSTDYVGDTISYVFSGNGIDGNIISDGASGLDIRAFAKDCEVVFYLDITGASGGGASQLIISDGTHDVTIYSIQTPNTKEKFIRLVFDYSGETVDVYEDGVLTQNNLDISSATTHWYIKLRGYTMVAGGGSFLLYGIGYSTGGVASTTFFSDSATISRDSIGGIVDLKYGNVGSSSDLVNVGFSADAGSNYATSATVLNFIPCEVANRGTGISLSAEISEPSSIDATAKNIVTITDFGGFWI